MYHVFINSSKARVKTVHQSSQDCLKFLSDILQNEQ